MVLQITKLDLVSTIRSALLGIDVYLLGLAVSEPRKDPLVVVGEVDLVLFGYLGQPCLIKLIQMQI